MPAALEPISHYKILALPEPTGVSPPLSPTEIKKAYKRALLCHHPDKSSLETSISNPSLVVPTVDQITQAYHVLKSPLEQQAYSQQFLASRRSAQACWSNQSPAQMGFEVIDLDDMHFDEQAQLYYKECRCGRRKSYLVSEAQLEENVEDGEVTVGCEGCSLWICINFQVAKEAVGG